MWNWFYIFYAALFSGSDELPPDALLIQEGTASYYGTQFHNRMTANGEIFHKDSLTAAHKDLPFGMQIKVTRKDTGASVWVRINDRLPDSSTRIIDLSKAAAQKIDMVKDGIADVRLEVKNLDELDRLIESFSGQEVPGLRLRPYNHPVIYQKSQPF